jgi:hypothetical protein
MDNHSISRQSRRTGDVGYDEEADPDFEEGAQVDYEKMFPDADKGAGNQEWRARSQK